MASRSNSAHCLLRLLGCCFALTLTNLFSLPASGMLIAYSGTFEDDGSNPDNEPDDFRLTNDATSTENIVMVVFDLSTASIGTTFDPAKVGFCLQPCRRRSDWLYGICCYRHDAHLDVHRFQRG